MTHISFPSINQFRQVVKGVCGSAQYHDVAVPTIQYEGTVKSHGTNGGIIRPAYTSADKIYFQSRERILSIESDNAAFAFTQEGNREFWNNIFNRIELLINPAAEDSVQIYGEWAGGSIQKGVGVSGLPKMFIIFGVRISKNAESSDWLDSTAFAAIFDADKEARKALNVYTKYDFPTFYVDIDFNRPDIAQSIISDLTLQVETECPVARYFRKEDSDLVGEGLVFTPVKKDLPFSVADKVFKSKGIKHSVSKVKTIGAVDTEKMESLHQFIDYAVTENRLLQGLEKMEETGVELTPENTGVFLRWILNDIIKEEIDTMRDSNLTPKDVTSKIANVARQFWFKQMEF